MYLILYEDLSRSLWALSFPVVSNANSAWEALKKATARRMVMYLAKDFEDLSTWCYLNAWEKRD